MKCRGLVSAVPGNDLANDGLMRWQTGNANRRVGHDAPHPLRRDKSGPWRVGALTVARIASMGTKPWRAMDEYKFLQTICEDGRPADCVPFINRCQPFALQCPESRVLHPLQFVPLLSQFDNNILFFGRGSNLATLGSVHSLEASKKA